ncbi:NACHT domain-containing NTPase [Nodosilinea sp. LEGE 07088]|uniref:NACHT domain-containing protein n=1 Tax=Nodosilinea sp. LEGE 07088 TaxID=2777968 RepID=UPI001D13B10F|nr:NACHT domain-containing protein [Nodosilinea sp. LEGE 07088]
MTGQRSQVKRPWDADLRTASQAPKPLAPGTPIVEVFDGHDIGGKLLLLGNPGAGKTTTMLDLAAALIQRANADPEEPIPVMLNLSSWQNPQQSCTDWLLKELKSKYGVSPKLGQNWLTEKKLLPLLDGLDELPSARQEPVVQSLNIWLQSEEGTPRLLVCSRLEEYELYTAKLALNGAICLNPLTDEQVKGYLASLHMEALWDTLQQDEDLLGLMRTPLLLSVSILVNDAFNLTQWQRLGTTQERMDYLLDAYIVRRLHEPVNSQEYSPERQPTAQQIQRWLMLLAQKLKTQSKDEFLIEEIQPFWLSNSRQKLIYRLIVGLLFGFVFALGGLAFKPIYGVYAGLLSLPLRELLGFIRDGQEFEFKDVKLPDSINFSDFYLLDRMLLGGLGIGGILGIIFSCVGLFSGLLSVLIESLSRGAEIRAISF